MLQLSLWSVLNCRGFPSLLHRGFCAAPKIKVDKENLRKLRKRTGFPFIKCKDALQRFENNLKEAEKWMREEALKQGWATAGKLANRPLSQGLIGIRHIDGSAILLEVNCETDFVSRNTAFRSLVSSISQACMREGNQRADDNSSTKIEWSREEIESFVAPSSEDKRIGDLVAMCIGSLGENMRVRRAGFMSIPKGDEMVLTHYCHTQFSSSHSENCIFGSYGSLLLLRKTSPGVDAIVSGRNLCQHIVGMNPLKVGDADVDKPCADVDEETIMLFQPYLLDENKTVSEYAAMHGVVPVDFLRYQCGESLPGDDD